MKIWIARDNGGTLAFFLVEPTERNPHGVWKGMGKMISSSLFPSILPGEKCAATITLDRPDLVLQS